MEAVGSPNITRRINPEDQHLNLHSRENLKTHVVYGIRLRNYNSLHFKSRAE